MTTSRNAKRSPSRDERIPTRSGATDNVVELPSARRAKVTDASQPSGEGAGQLDLLVDGRRVTVEADRELVLRCGEASITLTRAGKIILRGTHVVSKSSGANRVQGSQVRIN